MSSLTQTAVNASAHAAATPVPTVAPTPSATPVAHVTVVHAAVAHVSSLVTFLNQIASAVPQAEWVALWGAALVVLQSLMNKLPWLQHDVAEVQDLIRTAVAMGLPTLVMALGTVLFNHNLMPLVLPTFATSYGMFRVAKVVPKVNLSGTSKPAAPAAPLG